MELHSRIPGRPALAARLPPGLAGDADRSGIRSARHFANRTDHTLYLSLGGEWIAVTPADPDAFLGALAAEQAGNTRVCH